MKKFKVFIFLFMITIIFIGFSNVFANTKTKSVPVATEKTSSNSKESVKENQYKFDDYLGLIGLSNEELLSKIHEEPVSLDENFESFSRETYGLGFPKLGIKVWFSDYGKGTIDQVYIYNKNIDIKGLKIGDNISNFKKVFGEPLKVEVSSPYMDFEYNNKILSIYYNLKTGETYGLYIIEKSEYSTEYVEHKNNRYEIAGIEDPIAFEKTFNTIKGYVAEDNKEKVAEYISYPINIYNNNGKDKMEIKNKEDFIKNYNQIITQEVKNAFLNQKVEETFVNYLGVMVSNGEIWFGGKRADESSPWEYVIITINHTL